jgi:hypothetical protein
LRRRRRRGEEGVKKSILQHYLVVKCDNCTATESEGKGLNFCLETSLEI